MAAPCGADNASTELEGRGRIVNTEARAGLEGSEKSCSGFLGFINVLCAPVLSLSRGGRALGTGAEIPVQPLVPVPFCLLVTSSIIYSGSVYNCCSALLSLSTF